jgi:hypothetical protein
VAAIHNSISTHVDAASRAVQGVTGGYDHVIDATNKEATLASEFLQAPERVQPKGSQPHTKQLL